MISVARMSFISYLVIAQLLWLVSSFPGPRSYGNLTSRAETEPPVGGVTVVRYSFPLGFDGYIWNVPIIIPVFQASRYRRTQLQGLLFYPENFERTHSHPLILLLPGAHKDCRTYVQVPGWGHYPEDLYHSDDFGRCQEGDNIVKSHEGFRYLGYALASKGYFVISIDPLMLQAVVGEDRDPGVIAPRARLVLRTIEKLRSWDADSYVSQQELGVDISNAIDFNEVGLLGHSRGGQAMRYAANILMSPEILVHQERRNWARQLRVRITALLEVAPTDFVVFGDRVTTVAVPSLIFLAGCEDDIVSYDGYRVAKRASLHNQAPSYGITVYGASHSFFNSEWHFLNGDACLGDQINTWDTSAPRFSLPAYPDPPTPLVLESKPQQDTLTWAATALFAGHVGRTADLAKASVLKSPSAVEPLSGYPSVSGVELGHWNPNLARSKVLRDFAFANGVEMDPEVGGALTLVDQADFQWPEFRALLRPDNIPPNVIDDDLMADYYLWNNGASDDAGVVVSVSIDAAVSTLKIPLQEYTGAQNPTEFHKGTCEIHVDVARRDTCYMIAPHNEKKTCALPPRLDLVLNVGQARSPSLELKSRFNLEFGTANLDADNHDELCMMPIAWETLVAPCDEPTNEITITLTNPEKAQEAAAGAGDDSHMDTSTMFTSDVTRLRNRRRRDRKKYVRSKRRNAPSARWSSNNETSPPKIDNLLLNPRASDDESDDESDDNDDGGDGSDSESGMTDGIGSDVNEPESFLYVGQVRMTYDCGMNTDFAADSDGSVGSSGSQGASSGTPSGDQAPPWCGLQ